MVVAVVVADEEGLEPAGGACQAGVSRVVSSDRASEAGLDTVLDTERGRGLSGASSARNRPDEEAGEGGSVTKRLLLRVKLGSYGGCRSVVN